MFPWKLRKRHILTVNQNLLSVYFSLAKFQLVICNLSLTMILANGIYSQTAKAVFSHLNYRRSSVITYSVIPQMGLSHKNIIIGNDPNAPNTTGITLVLTTHIFPTSFSRSCYFSNFSFSFSHTLASSTVAISY